MSRRVLVICASPRKDGNSQILADEFARGAREAEHSVTLIRLADLSVSHCLACGSCQANGGVCVQHDDMSKVLSEMLLADDIVFATPVYFGSMSGLLKNMIDRSYSRYGELTDKRFFFVVTGARSSEAQLDAVAEEMRRYIEFIPGAEEGGHIFDGEVLGRGDVRGRQSMRLAYDMGRRVRAM